MLTIAWDVDDVLNNLMGCWLEKKWKIDRPDYGLNFEEIKVNSPHDILGITLEEYQASLDEFRLSPDFPRLEPDPKILEWFNRYGYRARHLALTAVPQACAHVSAEWTFRHFGKWIRTFHFVPSYRERADCPDYDQSKAEFLQWISKVDVLVEDNESNAKAAAQIGVQSILVDRPWNSSDLSLTNALSQLLGMVDQ